MSGVTVSSSFSSSSSSSFSTASSIDASFSSAFSPRLVILLSGKRKSGKDFVAEALIRHFSSLLSDPTTSSSSPPSSSSAATLIRLSAPLKRRFADERGLDFHKLLDSSEYKEKYRREMIVWGEERRRADPGFFCRAAIEDAFADGRKSAIAGQTTSSRNDSFHTSIISSTASSSSLAASGVWIISDARRLTDLKFFRNHFSRVLVTIRVCASEACRRRRGWNWTSGVDDAESECGLDEIDNWDFVLLNNDDVDDNQFQPSSKSFLNLTEILSKLKLKI